MLRMGGFRSPEGPNWQVLVFAVHAVFVVHKGSPTRYNPKAYSKVKAFSEK